MRFDLPLDSESFGSDSSSLFEFEELRHLRGTITSTGKSPEPLFSNFWKNSGFNSLSVKAGAFFFNITTALSGMLPPLLFNAESLVGEVPLDASLENDSFLRSLGFEFLSDNSAES